MFGTFVVFSCDSDPSSGRWGAGAQLVQRIRATWRNDYRFWSGEDSSFLKWNLGDVAVCDVRFVFDMICFNPFCLSFCWTSHVVYLLDRNLLKTKPCSRSPKWCKRPSTFPVSWNFRCQALQSVTQEQRRIRDEHNVDWWRTTVWGETVSCWGCPLLLLSSVWTSKIFVICFLGRTRGEFSHLFFFFFRKSTAKSERKKHMSNASKHHGNIFHICIELWHVFWIFKISSLPQPNTSPIFKSPSMVSIC